VEGFALVLGLLLGLVFTAIGVTEVRKRRFGSGQWIKQTAVIVNRGIDETQDMDSRMPRYSPWIQYEYEYQGKKYRSDRQHLATSGIFTVYNAHDFLETVNPGAERQVWVSEKYPAQSSAQLGQWIGWAFGGLFGLLLVVFSIYQLSR
jgi:hypothetical protein